MFEVSRDWRDGRQIEQIERLNGCRYQEDRSRWRSKMEDGRMMMVVKRKRKKFGGRSCVVSGREFDRRHASGALN